MADKSDRELLELAAKAAGMPASIWWWVDGVMCKAGDKCTPWNPLTDDGDALRLAVAIGHRYMTKFEVGSKGASVEFDDHDAGAFETHKSNGGDPCAATRRAIVRAAAAIGEAMEVKHDPR